MLLASYAEGIATKMGQYADNHLPPPFCWLLSDRHSPTPLTPLHRTSQQPQHGEPAYKAEEREARDEKEPGFQLGGHGVIYSS